MIQICDVLMLPLEKANLFEHFQVPSVIRLGRTISKSNCFKNCQRKKKLSKSKTQKKRPLYQIKNQSTFLSSTMRREWVTNICAIHDSDLWHSNKIDRSQTVNIAKEDWLYYFVRCQITMLTCYFSSSTLMLIGNQRTFIK